MNKLKLILGLLWASPVTIASFLFYVAPLWFLKKYSYSGWDEVAWVWTFDPDQSGEDVLTKFLREKWARWAGSTVGNIIIVKDDGLMKESSRQRLMVHEKVHVKQIMFLGIFQPILYSISYLVGRFILKNVDGYYDNIFEIDARRKAGEVVGIINKLNKK